MVAMEYLCWSICSIYLSIKYELIWRPLSNNLTQLLPHGFSSLYGLFLRTILNVEPYQEV